MQGHLPLVLTFFALPLLIYGVFWLLQWGLRRSKWKRARSFALTEADRSFLQQNFYPYPFLSLPEKESLELKIRYFLANKKIDGVGGLILGQDMKLLIAAHACLLLVNFEVEEIYPGLTNIFVTPSGFVEKDNPVNPYTGQPLYVPKLGESWKRGPIILSWETIRHNSHHRREGQNLIYHEFSHQLDQQDGYFDGTPALASQKHYQLWARVMGDEFAKLRRLVKSHRPSDIDSYGASNEAEFFAVCTEYFLTDPERFQGKHPELFELFRSFFKLDPLRWR